LFGAAPTGQADDLAGGGGSLDPRHFGKGITACELRDGGVRGGRERSETASDKGAQVHRLTHNDC
jgi:hypothetical protein